jgi:hypothetical protein
VGGGPAGDAGRAAPAAGQAGGGDAAAGPSGRFGGVAALPRPVHLWDIHDGKIARFRQFADTAKFLEIVAAEVPATA